MLVRRTNIAEDKIVLRYEKSWDKLDLISFKVERNLQTKPDKVKALWLYDVFLREGIKKIKNF
jgi:hypothetical protein